MKFCKKCNSTKPLTGFNKDRTKPDGLESYCKLCKSTYKKQYRGDNIEKISQQRKDCYIRNRDKELTRRKKYCLENREVITSYNSKRRAAKLNAIPSWADLEEIRKIYKDAKIITETTKVRHVVDHIIPLKGVDVSGLHVENNLRIVTWAENLVKSNKLMEELVI